MKLLIDIGNTLTKYCYDSSPEDVNFILTKEVSDELLEKTFKLLNVEHVYISSVVPKVGIIFENFFLRKNINYYFVTSTNQNIISVKIDNPNELGSDLLCDLIGASSLIYGPTLIIDLGTASKILYLDKDNNFSYCAIIPGLESSINVLSNTTAQLNKYELVKPLKLTQCSNTSEVVIASVVYSHADSVNGLVRRFENELGITCKKIITGGYAKELKEYFDFEYQESKCLTLVGLLELSKRGN